MSAPYFGSGLHSVHHSLHPRVYDWAQAEPDYARVLTEANRRETELWQALRSLTDEALTHLKVQIDAELRGRA